MLGKYHVVVHVSGKYEIVMQVLIIATSSMSVSYKGQILIPNSFIVALFALTSPQYSHTPHLRSSGGILLVSL
jgi:hypothetical protein